MRIVRKCHPCAFVGSVCLGVALSCSVCCAALFRCAHLSALACRDALCAMLCGMLHQQRMAATATRATATLFHGDQVPATSEAPRCCHTPVGGAGSKHPGPANENCAHFSSHLISCVRLRWLYGPGRCAALCCIGKNCLNLTRAAMGGGVIGWGAGLGVTGQTGIMATSMINLRLMEVGNHGVHCSILLDPAA